jgi:nicotinamide riboside kinase
MTKIINLFGGPGTGKSTCSASLFALMKLQSMEVELVTEYAKDLVWAERNIMFTEQDYIFAKQNHRLRRLRGKVDWVVTDSSLILGHFYIPDDFPGKEYFCPFVNEMFNSYDNINIVLTRDNEYNPNGRNQTEEEAREIDKKIVDFLAVNGVPYRTILANKDAPMTIFNNIEGK